MANVGFGLPMLFSRRTERGCHGEAEALLGAAEVPGRAGVAPTKATRPEIARTYGAHSITLAKWKKHFVEHGSEVFGGKEEMKRAQQHRARLERMVGQKEVEIALLRNFLGDPGDASGNQ